MVATPEQNDGPRLTEPAAAQRAARVPAHRPGTGEAVHRDDGELVGLLARAGERWVPCTVFGYALGEPQTREAAIAHLHAAGLSVLAERWECRDGDEWLTVGVVEASREAVTVVFADYGRPEIFGARRTLGVPVEGRLRLASGSSGRARG